MASALSLHLKQIFVLFYQKEWHIIWDKYVLPRWLPLLVGAGLGVVLAKFIVDETWHLVGLIIVSVPAALVLLNYPFAAILLWLAISPLFVVTVNDAQRSIFWVLHRAMIPATIILVIFARQFGETAKQKKPLFLGWVDVATLGFIGLISANILLFSDNPNRLFILFYDRILISFCLYWLIRLLTPDEKDLKRLIWTALIILVFESIIGLMSWFAPALLPLQWRGPLLGYRTYGTLREPAEYGMLLVFSAFLLFQWAMNHKPGVIRTLFMSGFGLGMVMVWFTFSRGSWLGAIIAVIGLLPIYPKAILRMAAVVVVVMGILIGGILATQYSYANERINQSNTIDNRILLLYTSLNMVKEKPFMGWGYENFNRYKNDFIDRSIVKLSARDAAAVTSHNTYLTIIIELGLIGFFLYIFPFFWWFKATLQVLPHMPRDGLQSWSLVFILWLVIISYFVTSNFSDQRFSVFGVPLWWMTLGLIANLVTQYFDSDNDTTITS